MTTLNKRCHEKEKLNKINEENEQVAASHVRGGRTGRSLQATGRQATLVQHIQMFLE